MQVALAQINPVVGDINGNTARIIDLIAQARNSDCELIVFPELAVFGYPPKDLLLRSSFIEANVAALQQIAKACDGLTAVVGFVKPVPGGGGKGISNAAAVCRAGKVIATYAKRLLPTYDVFDEARYFSPGNATSVVTVPFASGPVNVGITICEDIWNDAQFGGRPVYGVDPIKETIVAGAELIVNIGASPFTAGKQELRESLFSAQVRGSSIPLIAVNQVGGNDDLLFDGAGFVLGRDGTMIARAGAFQECMLEVDTEVADAGIVTPYPDPIESIRAALVLGIGDYLGKCGFSDSIIGLSGGIDSAVTAALAVEALGEDRVWGVAMPSRFSSDHSLADARALSENLGIRLLEIDIEGIHHALESALAPQFAGLPSGLAEENLQARIRGNLLMALSNKFGHILLTTGNKSEMAVGYCTLYGDMCGGLGVLSDVPKTTVFKLARLINRTSAREVIPENTITKPPSAELRSDQFDSDTLPPYDTLDVILQRYIEEDVPVDSIIGEGFDEQTVRDIVLRVDRSEYKRQQAAVGLKVTSRAFGSGRRMPIAWRNGI